MELTCDDFMQIFALVLIVNLGFFCAFCVFFIGPLRDELEGKYNKFIDEVKRDKAPLASELNEKDRGQGCEESRKNNCKEAQIRFTVTTIGDDGADIINQYAGNSNQSRYSEGEHNLLIEVKVGECGGEVPAVEIRYGVRRA